MSDTNTLTSDWANLYQQTLTTTTPDMAIFNPTATTSPTAALSPEGRVGKSPKRRTRASRRAPTTLLNTDTANFRAMVQQFTGISGYQPGSTRPFINFAATQPTSTLPFRQQYQGYQQYPQADQFTAGSNNTGDVFLHGFNDISLRADVDVGQEGFLMQNRVGGYTEYEI